MKIIVAPLFFHLIPAYSYVKKRLRRFIKPVIAWQEIRIIQTTTTLSFINMSFLLSEIETPPMLLLLLLYPLT
jgi:hypothetical protein